MKLQIDTVKFEVTVLDQSVNLEELSKEVNKLFKEDASKVKITTSGVLLSANSFNGYSQWGGLQSVPNSYPGIMYNEFTTTSSNNDIK